MKIILTVAGLFAIIIIGIVVFLKLSPVQQSTAPSVSNISSTGLVKTVPGDFLRDGKPTYEDVALVKSHLGCKKSDPCWGEVVGKTHDGDNPLYTSDLDMNGDGVIDTADIPAL